MLAALDTSTRYAGVALYDERGLLAELNWLAGNNHTRQLLPNLESLLQGQGAAVRTLQVVVVALGPGSFNGLRVALSTAKGLCLGLSVPLVTVGTLAATAYAQRLGGLPICATIDAGRGQIYGALFDPRDDAWPATGITGVRPLPDLLTTVTAQTIFCGELGLAGRALVAERLGTEALLAGPATGARRAACLAELGWQRWQAGALANPATAQAIYVQRPPVPPAP
jgi:tRNA threonylcarbamoyladenosine biosynthesis protein TsaB